MLEFRIITSLLILFSSEIVSSSFLVEPESKTTVLGETVVFKCAVTDDVQSVNWYYTVGTTDAWISLNRNIYSEVPASKQKRYSIIGDASKREYFLEIRNVSTTDVGDYRCFYYPDKVTSPNRTPEVSLVVVDPPKTPLCAIKKADTAIPSPIVVMRCTSTGDPTPQVVWLRNGSPIEGNVPRASINMFTWNVTEADSGAVFSCVVDYPKMASPPSCKLTPLEAKPVVAVVPSVQTLALNNSGKFVCESTDIPKPLKYKWFINGMVPPMLMIKDVHYRIKHGGKTLKILWVVQELNDAEVTCRVTGSSDLIYYGSARAYVSNEENEDFLTTTAIPDENTGKSDTNGSIEGSKSSNCTPINNTGAKGVLLLGPPKTPLCAIKMADTVFTSSIITMSCTSTGDPTPQVVWLRNGSPIEGNVPRVSINTLLWNITEADSGAVFSCVVDYPKTALPPSCKLTPLKVNPVVSVEPSVQTLVLNNSGEFVCKSTGIPNPLKYKWFIDGMIPSRIMEKGVHYRIKNDGKTLKILWVVQELHDTVVTCRVTGSSDIYYGSAHAYVRNADTNGTTEVSKSSVIRQIRANGALDKRKSSNGTTIIGIDLSLLGLSVFIIVYSFFVFK